MLLSLRGYVVVKEKRKWIGFVFIARVIKQVERERKFAFLFTSYNIHTRLCFYTKRTQTYIKSQPTWSFGLLKYIE